MRRPLVVVTLAIGLLASAYGALILLDLLARSESQATRPVPVGERVRLETGSGDIAVVASDGPPRVELRTVAGLWGEPRVTIGRRPGGVVSIDADCPGISFLCSVEARLLVPAGTVLVARTGSGSVTVRGLRGGVDAETGSGDVRLAGVGGELVRAETGSGSITGRDLTASTLIGDTGSGDVELAARRAPESVEADTGSGDVELTVPDVGYRIATDTGSGDQRVDVRPDPRSPRRLRVDTGSGDVTVRPAR